MKFHFVTLGCPKNRVDSEVMFGSLLKNNYEYTDTPKEAELIVINSCTFIEDAKKESIDTILEMAQFKETGALKKLVVAGCLAQRYQSQAEKLFPEVDYFIGTGEYYKITSILESEARGNYSIPSYIHTYSDARINSMPSYTAYLKLTEGCDRKCAFCIIPSIRGKQKSQTIENLVTEAKILAEGGVRELNLIGQDLTSYGTDLKDGTTGLSNLLKELVKIDPLRWIRLLYCYPDRISDELITLFKKEEKICRYIDMPLQHIDDDILIAMKRGVNQRRIRQIVERLKKEIPNLIFRTSFITGYPGESEEKFRKLYDFVKEMEFDRVGIFTYSQEEGTLSASLMNQIPSKIKRSRKDALLLLQSEISLKKQRALVESEIEVLVEGWDEKKNLYRGRHWGQAPDIDGFTYVSSERGSYKAGEFATCLVKEGYPYDLIAKPFLQNGLAAAV